MSAILVFQLKFNLEFTRQAVCEFFLNRIARGKHNYWAKLKIFFSEPRYCANNGNPFKVSCQDLAKRKQDITQTAVINILKSFIL